MDTLILKSPHLGRRRDFMKDREEETRDIINALQHPKGADVCGVFIDVWEAITGSERAGLKVLCLIYLWFN